MPDIDFFSTQIEIIRGLNTLQLTRPLQFIRCDEENRIQSETVEIYFSLEDAVIEILGKNMELPESERISRENPLSFKVMNRGVKYWVESEIIPEGLPGGGNVQHLMYAEDDAYQCFLSLPGLDSDMKYMWNGTLKFDEVDEITTYEGIKFYWDLRDAVIGDSILFKGYHFSDASKLFGKNGVQLSDTKSSSLSLWNYESVYHSKRTGKTAPQKPATGRLSFEESWDWLEIVGFEPPRDNKGNPLRFKRVPKSGDINPAKGLSLFKSIWDEEADFDRLTLAFTNIKECGFYQAYFVYTDFSNSCFANNDFDLCDFSNAVMVNALVSVEFVGCRFDGADLTDMDFSHSEILYCSFKGANMKGTKLLKEQIEGMELSTEQLSQITVKKSPTYFDEQG